MSPGATAAEYLYVYNTRNVNISKISIPDHEVVPTIPIGPHMDCITYSPDLEILYMSRIETPNVHQASNIRNHRKLTAFRTETDEICWQMHIDAMRQRMTASMGGKRIFVPYSDTWWVSTIGVE